jgi:hypothetical protein
MPSIPGIGGFGAPGFGGGAMGFPHHGGFAAPIPTIVYLITSARPDFAAYLTDNPMGRPRPRATRSTSWCYNWRNGWYVPLLDSCVVNQIGHISSPVEHVNFIQLDAEDVES